MDEHGAPWWVATAVGEVLGYANIADALKRLDDDERHIVSIYTSTGIKEMWAINEPGLYNLLLVSRKPEAKRFKTLEHACRPAHHSQDGAYSIKASMLPPQLDDLRAL
jgi:anti-repressor protein